MKQAKSLPESFLRWNYFPRRESAKAFLKNKHAVNMNLFFLDSTRHTPALCTAFLREDGTIYVNAKIVGVGYVLKEKFLSESLPLFQEHLEHGDKLFLKAKNESERRVVMRAYQKHAMRLFLRFLYLEPEEAYKRVDFTKLSTIELAKNVSHSSKHTWNIVQKNKTACLLFYRPPSISFELHGWLEIHESGVYYDFVNTVHDAFHYASPEKRKANRPVYLFNVEEVYSNSPTSKGFGTRIA